MERIVLRAFDREIVENGGRIEFRKRLSGGFVVALAIFVVAACFYGAGLVLRSMAGELGALGSFAIGGAGLMAVIGVLAIAGTLFLSFVPGRRVFADADAGARTFRLRGRTIPFSAIERFSLVPSSHGMRAFCLETVGGEVLQVWIVTGKQSDALDKLSARLDALLAHGSAGVLPMTAPATSAPIDPRFRTSILLAMGLLWTVGGFFFFRGLVFTSRLQPEGLRIPVWSAGLVILVLGVYEWIKSRRR